MLQMALCYHLLHGYFHGLFGYHLMRRTSGSALPLVGGRVHKVHATTNSAVQISSAQHDKAAPESPE